MDAKGKNPGDVGLLEYLEDIIGSNRHVESIGQLEVAIEESDELRLEQTNRVKADHAQIRELESDCKLAADFIKTEREHYKLQVFRQFIILNEEIASYN